MATNVWGFSVSIPLRKFRKSRDTIKALLAFRVSIPLRKFRKKVSSPNCAE